MTIWYKVENGYSLQTIDGNNITLYGKEVTCDDFLNEIYIKTMEIIKTWRFTVNITFEEIQAAWDGIPIQTEFKTRKSRHDGAKGWMFDYNMSEKFKNLKLDISKMYLDKLGRYPTRDEVDFSFSACFWEYSGDTKKCKPEYESIANGREVEIDRCVVCGEMVTASNPNFLNGGGEIKMSFGYGSLRDLEYATAYIHDRCSAVLDQKLFKIRMRWDCVMGDGDRIDLDACENEDGLPRDDGIDLSSVDVFDRIMIEHEIDFDNNEEYYRKKKEYSNKKLDN